MQRPSLIQQIYGYAVCLVAIITFLIAASNFIEAMFARIDPLRTQSGRYAYPEASLTSFEAFQATYQQSAGPKAPEAKADADTLTTEQLRQRYTVLRADRLDRVGFDAMVRLVMYGLLMLLAAALFAGHWKWLRALGADRSAAA